MRPGIWAIALFSLVLLAGATAPLLRARTRAAAQGEPDQPTADPSALTLQCTARGLPVGRAANVWQVECSVTSAPADDTDFEVWAFGIDGRPVCTGDLSGGEGTCTGRLTIALEEDLGPLTFAARINPSGGTAADLAPTQQPARGPH